RHAELGEAAEGRLLVGAEIAHRLVETDEAFLQEIVVVAAGEEVRARLEADEPGVAAGQGIHRDLIPVFGFEDDVGSLLLSLSFLRRIRSRGTRSHWPSPGSPGLTLTLWSRGS